MVFLKKLANADISIIEKRIVLWFIAFTVAFIANTAHNMDKAIVSLQVTQEQAVATLNENKKCIKDLEKNDVKHSNELTFIKTRLDNVNEKIIHIEREVY